MGVIQRAAGVWVSAVVAAVAVTAVASPLASAVGSAQPFVPVSPARLLDTRSSGAKVGTPDGSGAPLEIQVTGRAGLPASDVGAVALNVTAVDGESPGVGTGFVTVYPCGTRPEVSNLNFRSGETIPNAVIAPVSATGTVCFYVYGRAHLLADVSGYFPAASGFVAAGPSRLLDTRSEGDKVGALDGTGAPLVIDLAGRGGLPAAGIGAVALNVTVAEGEAGPAGGYVTVYPCGDRSEVSNLNFRSGQTIPNAVIAPVSAAGTVCFYVYGRAHLLADVSGFFPVASGFVPLTPSRLTDTRPAGVKIGAADGSGAPLEINVFGKFGLPTSGISAVALNVTVAEGESPIVGGGYVTVYPCGEPPEVSNLNFSAGQTIPNAVIAPVTTAGTVCVYVYGTAHLLVDVSGYFPGEGVPAPPPVLPVVSTVAVGRYHSCAIFDGAAKCWGSNHAGELGNGSPLANFGSSTPVQVAGLTSGVTAITAGSSHTCVIQNGAAKCWGAGFAGQLGDGGIDDRSTPVSVIGLESGVTAISATSIHTCAIQNGAAKCWGDNGSGQLGNGITNPDPVPVPVTVSGLTSGVTAIGAGGNHTCAVRAGAVRCWGDNSSGQLGNGTNSPSYTPVAVVGLAGSVSAVTAGTLSLLRRAPGSRDVLGRGAQRSARRRWAGRSDDTRCGRRVGLGRGDHRRRRILHLRDSTRGCALLGHQPQGRPG